MMRRCLHGQAMPEFLYALPILLLLTLGAIQMGFIYQAKLTLNYAATVAVREGALRNGKMDAILDGMEAGLTPMFAHSLGSRDMAMIKKARLSAHNLVSNTKLTRITIVNPTSALLTAHQGDSESGSEIPNDNLMYRDATAIKGGLNVQDANILKIHVRICYRMFVPIINKLIYNLAVDPPGTPAAVSRDAPGMLRSYGAGSTTRTCTDRPDSDYYLPIEAEAVMRMQSPFQNPGKWVAP